MATRNAKAKRPAARKKTASGQLRVRRDESERRAIVDDRSTDLRREISDAVQAGERLRQNIESRIDAVLPSEGNSGKAARRR